MRRGKQEGDVNGKDKGGLCGCLYNICEEIHQKSVRGGLSQRAYEGPALNFSDPF